MAAMADRKLAALLVGSDADVEEAYGPLDRAPEPEPPLEEDEEGVCGSCGGDMGFLDYCPICGEEA